MRSNETECVDVNQKLDSSKAFSKNKFKGEIYRFHDTYFEIACTHATSLCNKLLINQMPRCNFRTPSSHPKVSS